MRFGRGTAETIALAHETQTIAIVFAAVSDPLGNGLAASLAHPGGNITGFTNIEFSMGGKWIELLKEIAPRTERVALRFNPTTAAPVEFYLSSIQTAAQSLGVTTFCRYSPGPSANERMGTARRLSSGRPLWAGPVGASAPPYAHYSLLF